MAAKCLNFANSIEGPSGVGKTETIKDLARIVGFQCLMFNSTMFMTEDTIGKIFKGIAGTGAWAVFDEFDRFNTVSMSVFSMMLFELIEAVRGKKTNLVFYGSEGTKVYDSMFVTFTMRPQSTKLDCLPDNLRYLVRQCTLKTPD
jgi:dynein heavy chain